MRIFSSLFITTLSLSTILFGADVVPAARRVTWTPGSTVGVPGGVAQYLDNSGSPNERNTADGLNAVTGYSADNTGASNTTTALSNMISALGTDQVGYIPIGVYRMDSSVNIGFKDNYTIRGASFNGLPYAPSTTTNTITGSGTVTFTVPAGVGWQSGDGVRVAARKRPIAPQIATITSSSTTATVTTTGNHPYQTGDAVRVRGASQTEYNGIYTITRTGATTFTYTFAGSATSPATGTIWVGQYNVSRNWMQGTVSSYSGTTLEISVSSSNGQGTWSDWMVSLTMIDLRGGIGAFRIGNSDTDYQTFQGLTGTDQAGNTGIANWVTLSGSPAKGDTVVTVSTATGLSVGQLCQTLIYDERREASLEAGESIVIGAGGGGLGGTGIEGALRRQLNRIVGISGTSVTLEIPLAFDHPAALAPKFLATSAFAKEVGLEDIWIAGEDPQTQLQEMDFAVDSWYKGVLMTNCSGFHANFYSCYMVEMRDCIIQDRDQNYSGSSGSGFAVFFSASSLFENNIVIDTSPGVEVNNGTQTSAFLYNYFEGSDGAGTTWMLMNHGPHNSYNLSEGNRAPYIQSDGFHGSSSDDTWAMNYFPGDISLGFGFASLNRWSWNYNVVGNIIGKVGVWDGVVSFGNPALGNSYYEGTIDPPGNGTWWRQFPSSGVVTATVADSTTKTITLQGGLTYADYEAPYINIAYTEAFFTIYWSGGKWRVGTQFFDASITSSSTTATVTTLYENHPYVTGDYVNIKGATQTEYNGLYQITKTGDTTFTYTFAGSATSPATGTIFAGQTTTGSGTSIVLSQKITERWPLGTEFPANGTTVYVYPGQSGYQESDQATLTTAIYTNGGNYLVTGAGGSQQSLAGATLPSSYAYGESQPSWWPTSLTWPPYDPASPVFSEVTLPAGYLYNNGYAAPDSAPSGTATVTNTTTVTGTLTLP